MSLYLAAIITYFICIVSIGIFVHRRNATSEDFAVGGRSLNFWVTALSAHASDMSSWLFLALPGLIYLQGLQGVWIAVGLWIGMWGAWRFVAPKLRVETEKTRTYTVTGYLAKRFGGDNSLVAVTSGVVSLIFFSVYVASGFVGIGYLFEALLGTDRLLGIGLAVVVVAAYTAIGGFYSICWVDLWQALFLLLVILVVPFVMLSDMPMGALGRIHLFPLTKEGFSGGYQLLQGFLYMAGWGGGYFGQGHILSKFMGIQSAADLKQSQRVGLSWQALCLIAATAVGLLAQGFFSQTLPNAELAFVESVVRLFTPFLAGLILCGVLAATISTIDSQLIVLVSIISEDFYHRFFRKAASQREVVLISRASTLLVCGISFLVALLQHTNIMGLVSFAWSGLGSAFGPIILCALHTKIRHAPSAIAGIMTGTLVAVCWPFVNPFPMTIPALVPGFIASYLSIILVEWVTNRSAAASPS